MIEVWSMLPEQWQLHSAAHTAALADTPYADSIMLESALARSDDAVGALYAAQYRRQSQRSRTEKPRP